MTDPTVALHTALIAALDTACSCDVWDGVPQGTDYPYVVLDYMSSDNMDFLSSRMDDRYIYLSIWSRTTGQAEVMSIIQEIEVINEQPLTLTTGDMVSLRVERKRTYREPDALTFRGQVMLRIITTH
jgi:hypothetical protein